jgi:hypothetical protein
MFDRNMDVVSGARAPVLASALLVRIQELNRDYVELMLAEGAMPSPGAAMETLSPRLLDALAALDEPARDALSRCPFTLFSLAFDDARFWQTVLGDTAPITGDSVEVRYGALSAAVQLDLFSSPQSQRNRDLDAALDDIRSRFGNAAVARSSSLRTPDKGD